MKRENVRVARAVLVEQPSIDRPLPDPNVQPGVRNLGRVPRVLKDAIVYAAQSLGEDGHGTNGLVGYLRALARAEPKAFSSLLGRVLPLTLNTTSHSEVVFRSVEEVRAELKARGIPVEQIVATRLH